MNMEEITKKLREPFSFQEIEWKIQVTTQDKTRALVVPYVDSRAIQRRLDDAVGIFGWSVEYLPWQEKSQICRLSIYDAEHDTWISKSDGASNSDFEPIKGGLSDSLKRVASVWGVGRFLYQLEGHWCDIEPKGKSFDIKKDQYTKLEAAYNADIARIFNTPAVPANPNGNPVPAPSSAPQTPTNGQTPDYLYRVHSVKPSGKESQLVELVDINGELTQAYVKSSDATIKKGVNLKNVKIESKDSQYGKYNLIAKYELAA